jgi:23S rRNA (cytidine1920-2'-O)/16S rRNA (cytidine1409-2'-O)-methyltransferase
MVRRGLAESRSAATALVAGGHVLVGGAPADKPSRLVSAGDAVAVTGPASRYVGRGGTKLEAALQRFAVDPGGCDVLDAGASTGGFTDCLLQHGAASVTAVDVGRGQLHERLLVDSRVRAMERTDLRDLPAGPGDPTYPLVVADLSFISLRSVAAKLVELASPGGQLLILVKPQFEAGRKEASKGRGVIRDAEVWRRCLGEVSSSFESAGASIMGFMVSPLRGADGNVEYFVHLRAGENAAGSLANPGDAIDKVVAEAGADRDPA